MAINAIHVSFKEPENLRLNFITLKKNSTIKKIEIWLYYGYEQNPISNYSLISFSVYIILFFLKSTYFVRKIDFFQ